MTKEQAKKKISELTKVLNQHNYKYYVQDKPSISDFEFDKMLEELITLEQAFPDLVSPESPSQRVGGTITKSFNTIKHDYSMLSLGNTYSEEELTEFDNRVRKSIGDKFEYVCELKFDGVAISLKYVQGKLVQAVTRGDGEQGDDVTTNVKTIRSIPLELHNSDYPDQFIIRGEILMPKSVFNGINKEIHDELTEDGFDEEEIKEKLLKNPRNAASGTLKMQDSRIVSKRKLDCFLYFLLGKDLPFSDHYESLKAARKWGFKVSEYIVKVKDLQGVLDYIKEWETERFLLPFETDGVVVKVNNYQLQTELGFTAKSPRWAIAYKYKPESVATILNSVSYQVGRTGAITPVANLKPVQLSGTTVKRASLHNADQIEKLDLRLGDHVFVEKGGEIIPKITSVDLKHRDPSAEPIKYPVQCPECDTTLIRLEGEAVHYCPNQSTCPPQIKGKIEHFISRKAMNIDSLGEGKIEMFYDHGLIKDAADLYLLKHSDIIGLEKTLDSNGSQKKISLQEKSVSKILKGIEESKEVSFPRVLYAVGIRYVGETVAKKLATHFGSIDRIREATIEELKDAPEIGEKIAESIKHWFAQPENLELIAKLKDNGLQFDLGEQVKLMSNKLSGLTFVVSGKFTKFSRDELKETIELNGGKVSSGISSKTSYLVAGEESGPSKSEKAAKLDIKIITEKDFLNLLNG